MSRKIAFASAAALLAAALAATAHAASGPAMGPSARILRPAFHGYYDGHKDTYLNTDVSSKAEATAMHINYSAQIDKIEKTGTLSERDAHVVLNCPIIKVGKG